MDGLFDGEIELDVGLIVFLGILAGLAGLLVWLWTLPHNEWDWLEKRAPSWPYDTFAFVRSLLAAGLCLAIGVAFVWVSSLFIPQVNQPGPLELEGVVFIAVAFSPLLLWGMMMVFGWPEVLIPPGARRPEDDRQLRKLAVKHPLVMTAVLVAGSVIPLTTLGLLHHTWGLVAVAMGAGGVATWFLRTRLSLR